MKVTSSTVQQTLPPQRRIGGLFREPRAHAADVPAMKHALSEASLPHGFRFAATACGLKKTGALDLAVLCSDFPASAAAVFTQNLVVAAPVVISKDHLRSSKGRMRGVVVNAGNANCATGPAGYAAAQRTVAEAAKRLGCRAGRIVRLLHWSYRRNAAAGKNPARPAGDCPPPPPVGSFFRGTLSGNLHYRHASENGVVFLQNGRQAHPFCGLRQGRGDDSSQHGHHAGFCHHRCGHRAGAFAKNAARSDLANLQRHLDRWRHFDQRHFAGAGERRRGRSSIKSGSAAHRAFSDALEEVCRSLALQIVADGEGAQRVIEIEVRGAKSESAARRIAETIATSPLVKTAFAGGDPNWGRIFAAAGRSGVKFDPSLVEITMAGIPVLRRGRPLDFNERAASNRLFAKHVPIIVNMHAGGAIARYWTCDFTAEYVRINASYRT